MRVERRGQLFASWETSGEPQANSSGSLTSSPASQGAVNSNPGRAPPQCGSSPTELVVLVLHQGEGVFPVTLCGVQIYFYSES